MNVHPPEGLLKAVLDSWDRSDRILLNLLRAVPEEAWGARASRESPTVGELFSHMHFVRLALVYEAIPDRARRLPVAEWDAEIDAERMAERLSRSAGIVRGAVEACLRDGVTTEVHYDHPLLLLQHLIWHEAYHHGQIKLALRAVGRPLPDVEAGPISWDVWMDKAGETGEPRH